MNEVDWGIVRGPLPVRRMNARTTAALLDNPGCIRRNVLDTANVDTARMAAALGGAPQFGQSPFALGRGNRFETRVKDNHYAALVQVLRGVGFDLPDSLRTVKITAQPGRDMMQERARQTSEALRQIASGHPGAANVIDQAVTMLHVGSTEVYLEQDALAFRQGDSLRICEIKGFPIVDGSADPEKVGSAARQSAVYVASLQDTLGAMDLDPMIVNPKIVLICPRNYSVQPTAEVVDVTRELRSLRRQLRRRDAIDTQITELPLAGIANTASGTEEQHARALVTALPKRYVPDCISRCDMARVCRAEAQTEGDPYLLGSDAANLLAGLDSLATAVDIANGVSTAEEHQDVAVVLQRTQASRLRLVSSL